MTTRSCIVPMLLKVSMSHVLYLWFWRFLCLWQELENNYQILYCTHNSDDFSDHGTKWRMTTRWSCIVPILLKVLLWQEVDKNCDILCYSYNSEGFNDWYRLKNKFQNLYCTHDSDDFSDHGTSWRTTTRSCSRWAWVRGLWFLTV